MPDLTAPTGKPVGFRRKFITSCLQPVFTVLIDDNTTLIKTVDDWNEIPSLPQMRNTAYLFPSGIMEHCHCRNDSRYSAISLYVVR